MNLQIIIMRLGAIEIENFKSIKNLSMNVRPITILIGPNNSGKSSVLQALTLLKQSSGKQSITEEGPLLNLGNYSDLVHRHNEDLNIKILISGGIRFRDYEVAFRLGYTFDSNQVIRATGDLSIPSDHQILHGQGVLSGTFSWDHELGSDQRWVVKHDIEGVMISLTRTSTILRPSLSVTTIPSGKEAVGGALNSALTSLNKTILSALKRFYMVPALRGQETASLDLIDRPSDDFVDADGHSNESEKVIGTAAYKGGLIQNKVSNWFEKITGSKVSVRLVVGKRVSLEASSRGFSSMIVNEGFGPNQLASLLIPLAVVPKYSTLAIEEPEVHLHPSSQTKLAEVFVDEANTEHKHLIITTHSDYLVTALLTMVAEKRLKKEDLAIYSFEQVEGEAHVTDLKVDDNGRIAGGLPSFFKANIQQFKRYSDALQ